MSAVLLGMGQVRVRGELLPAAEGLPLAGLEPARLHPKEGLALINGTQVSTALALAGLFGAEDVFASAVVAGAMSVDALKGSDSPFDERIHQVRGQPGQIAVAREYRDLIAGCRIPTHFAVNRRSWVRAWTSSARAASHFAWRPMP
jgi:histidine ammonia-lyase